MVLSAAGTSQFDLALRRYCCMHLALCAYLKSDSLNYYVPYPCRTTTTYPDNTTIKPDLDPLYLLGLPHNNSTDLLAYTPHIARVFNCPLEAMCANLFAEMQHVRFKRLSVASVVSIMAGGRR